MATSLLWTIFCLGLLKTSEGQGCILGGSGIGLPSFQDYRGADDSRITLHHQAIIPSYKFECNQICGEITAWGVDVRADGRSFQLPDGIPYTLDFQVWRPSLTVDDSTGTGCYSLVGNNTFTSIPLSGGVAESLVPTPSDYIQFRPGDVLGVYVEVARGNNDGVVILTSPSSFTSELVWYASIAPTMATSQNGDCPYSVGSSGVLNTLTQAAPVISISANTYSCPPLPSMATTQPTPPPNPTTDSEETSTTATQQPQKPVNPQTTNDSPATDFEEATGQTEVRVPITSETATDLPSILRPSEPTDTGLIIGIVMVIIVVTASAVIVVIISIAVLFKKCSRKITTVAVPTTANQAYGLTHHSEGVEENIYNYPEVDLDNTIEAKQNEAYVTNADIITEGNQAYAMSIITETNTAYKPVTTVEAIDEYDYI